MQIPGGLNGDERKCALSFSIWLQKLGIMWSNWEMLGFVLEFVFFSTKNSKCLKRETSWFLLGSFWTSLFASQTFSMVSIDSLVKVGAPSLGSQRSGHPKKASGELGYFLTATLLEPICLYMHMMRYFYLHLSLRVAASLRLPCSGDL